MTTSTTARALRDAGLVWRPTKGDRFVIPDREMDGDVFVISDMTIEAQDLSSGQVLGFNGTTEWALDSVEASEALWLPHEGQLRELLGASFARLERRGVLWAVLTHRAGSADGAAPASTAAEDAEEAYAVALLATTAGTASQLLPVAAAGLAARLAGLDAAGWSSTVPDGVRTVADAVGGAVGGAGPDVATGWRAALEGLLQAWAVPHPAAGGAGSGDAVAAAAAAAEAGAEGVLVDLVTATWDVARATGGDEELDPAVVRRALQHVRAWPTADTTGEGDDVAQLLALTGR